MDNNGQQPGRKKLANKTQNMDPVYVTDETFEKQSFTLQGLNKGTYEGCTFLNCDLSNTNLSEIIFSECGFEGCNLSLANMTRTAFQDVTFEDCKMLGLRFEHCNPFGLSFGCTHCNLAHSSFFQLKLKKIQFRDSQLHDVDFAKCDLSEAVFERCDLMGAIFDQTNLEKADLTTSFNYVIDPEINRVRKARFSSLGLAGLLTKYKIEIIA